MKNYYLFYFLYSYFLGFSQITHAATPESISLIPVMKTNTTPSGKISYSAARSGLEGYRAFDGKPNYSTDGTYSA